jgi:hypothetical protein
LNSFVRFLATSLALPELILICEVKCRSILSLCAFKLYFQNTLSKSKLSKSKVNATLDNLCKDFVFCDLYSQLSSSGVFHVAPVLKFPPHVRVADDPLGPIGQVTLLVSPILIDPQVKTPLILCLPVVSIRQIPNKLKGKKGWSVD